jgi:hypothetical protein
MDLPTAREHIRLHLERMSAAYGRPLFDEWAVLSVGDDTRGVPVYSGPRPDGFRRTLLDDTAPLRAVAAGRRFASGDFEFAVDGHGTRYDALMMLGPTSYLVCNHTEKSLGEIRADRNWLKAQAIFFELGEKFRNDPLSG